MRFSECKGTQTSKNDKYKERKSAKFLTKIADCIEFGMHVRLNS